MTMMAIMMTIMVMIVVMMIIMMTFPLFKIPSGGIGRIGGNFIDMTIMVMMFDDDVTGDICKVCHNYHGGFPQCL